MSLLVVHKCSSLVGTDLSHWSLCLQYTHTAYL